MNDELMKKFMHLAIDISRNLTPTNPPTLFKNEVKHIDDKIDKKLLDKYKLSDSSQPSLEKGLRQAAFNGQHDDLLIFIQFTRNINALEHNLIEY